MTEMETDERKLLEFPDEILLEIFANFSDHTLMYATRVCKRFKIIAEDSFAKKYNGASVNRFYSVKISGESSKDEQKQYQLFFCRFGDHMKALKIDFKDEIVARNHWLIFFIQRCCKSTTKVNITKGREVDIASIIHCMPNLTHLCLESLKLLNQKWTEYTYPKLVHFSARNVEGDHNKFAVFINHNPQLEHLSLIRFIKQTNDALYTVNGKLNLLKKLELVGDKASFTKNSTILGLNSLKTLCVRANSNSFVPLLTSIRNGFKMIEELAIYVWDYYEFQVEDINILRSFNTLKTLEVTDGFELPFELLKILIVHLPNLVTFSLGNACNLCETNDDLLNVVSVCQKVSLLDLTINPELPILNYELCTRFANIMEINGSNLKLELSNELAKIILTQEEGRFIKDSFTARSPTHHVIYWKGYDAASSSSSTNLFELNEEILKKIASFLDGNALHAFYQTCTKAQQLVTEHVTNTVFHCKVTPRKCTNENVFMVLGEYVSRISINLDHYSFDEDDDEDNPNSASHQLKTKFMKCINQYCGESLVEMEIKESVQIETIAYWPNLRKLKISSYIDIQKLQLFHCPELTHLHIGGLSGSVVNVPVDWDNSFPNLTSLEVGCYDECVERFLCGLSRTICSRMKSLSLMTLGYNAFENNKRRCWLKLTNIIARFRRLVTLHLYKIKGIEESNFKFLFENCAMLAELSIFYEISCVNKTSYLEMCRTIKLNCKQMEVIQLVVKVSTFFSSSPLQIIYAMFPKVKFRLIDVELMARMIRNENGKCLCSLNKKQ